MGAATPATLMAIAMAAVGFQPTLAAQPAVPRSIAVPLDGEMVQASWRVKPTAEDLERVYPKLATMMNIEGVVITTCETEVDGTVSHCGVMSETPKGFGFGDAVLRLAPYFRMNPATLDGKPVRGTVTIPINFKMMETPTEAPLAVLGNVDEASLQLALKIEDLTNYSGHLRAAWQAWLDEEGARAVVEGHPQENQAALTAFRQGFEDVVAEEINLRARRLASRMSEDDLRSTAAFLATPAGRGWFAASQEPDASASQDFMRRLGKAARAHLCLEPTCHKPERASSQPSS